MSISPVAYAESLRVGTVDFVSPDQIKVLIDIEAPDGTALNTGTPRPFPRVNGYMLIPSDSGYLVGQVEWITIERSQYPKRRGLQDFGLIDLPYPLRKMSLNPLGCLIFDETDSCGNEHYKFVRGVKGYPSVGVPVLLPTKSQLRDIIESGANRRVLIGTSPLANDAKVMIDPDRLFGRHLAVLGNTGSGKSCSVAGLIRWSLDAAKKARTDDGAPNARFIVLDPNGEYAKTFEDLTTAKIFKVDASTSDSTESSIEKNTSEALEVPLWFWNSAEWCAFTQASAKTQRPTLIQSLRNVREGFFQEGLTTSQEMRRHLKILLSITHIEMHSSGPYTKFPHPKNFLEMIKKWRDGLSPLNEFSEEQSESLNEVIIKINSFEQSRSGNYPVWQFTRPEVIEFYGLLKKAHSSFGGRDTDVLPIDADIPRKFEGNQLIKSLEANAELLKVTDHVETLLMRVRSILSDTRMKSIASDSNIELHEWLENYIGDNKASNGSVTVIDLSLVPADIIHVLTAVIARITLESLQRYRKLNDGKTLPTVLVMEEAHTFVKRYKDDNEYHGSAEVCCKVFEKIAREGRKFGLGMVLSSQRPSELSPTVLSQCNSFLLHRISNERDQELVHKLVPDNLRGLLRDLPGLPSRNAFLLGWASELPVLVEMNHLPEGHRPKSNDPDYWDVWTGKNSKGEEIQRDVDWKQITDDWQQLVNNVENDDY
ncbi:MULTISPECIES: ATP-binding protein [Psychrobacter]|uniref:ATP-binding protein n=1 Tax=Psychrobacter TaxID=497 RepID=UPI003F9A8B3E